MSAPPLDETLRRAAELIRVGAARRHIFLCVHGKCAPADDSSHSWEFLKSRLKELRWRMWKAG